MAGPFSSHPRTNRLKFREKLEAGEAARPGFFFFLIDLPAKLTNKSLIAFNESLNAEGTRLESCMSILNNPTL